MKGRIQWALFWALTLGFVYVLAALARYSWKYPDKTDRRIFLETWHALTWGEEPQP